MRVSAKAEYACRAMLELSRCYKVLEVIQIHDIATRQDIPKKYLVQILLQLQRAGLVKSKRGAAGGYTLAKPPSEISLGDVLRTTDGPLVAIESLEEHGAGNGRRPLEAHSALREVWQDVQEQVSRVVDSISFEDICRRADKSTMMYYI
ncbi:MAG: Rrf2 family transcriptional regulator [Candidatus Latescibacteria bacterium]|nr:Rrf2 family transcriptional regulator [Candidatus Latescibacterota bacterium]